MLNQTKEEKNNQQNLMYIIMESGMLAKYVNNSMIYIYIYIGICRASKTGGRYPEIASSYSQEIMNPNLTEALYFRANPHPVEGHRMGYITNNRILGFVQTLGNYLPSRFWIFMAVFLEK